MPVSFGVTLSFVSFITGIPVLYTGLGIVQSLPEQRNNRWSEIVGPAHCKVGPFISGFSETFRGKVSKIHCKIPFRDLNVEYSIVVI